MPTYTPEEYADKLTEFGKGFPTVVAKATLAGAQLLRQDIPGRIHRRGGTKDINGGTRGYRSDSHVNEREFKRLQINRVDHTFTGDLQRSYKLFTNERSDISLRIFGNKNIDKARGNERWFEQENNSKVWEASEKEEKRSRKAFDKVISDYIKKFFG